jgi:hypothetical protein
LGKLLVTWGRERMESSLVSMCRIQSCSSIREVHQIHCMGKNMCKPLSHLGQGDKWTTKWFFLNRTLLHKKDKEAGAHRREMQSHLQPPPLLRFLLRLWYLRRHTLIDCLRPRNKESLRTFWRYSNKCRSTSRFFMPSNRCSLMPSS